MIVTHGASNSNLLDNKSVLDISVADGNSTIQYLVC